MLYHLAEALGFYGPLKDLTMQAFEAAHKMVKFCKYLLLLY
jgi:hypothetical protein